MGIKFLCKLSLDICKKTEVESVCYEMVSFLIFILHHNFLLEIKIISLVSINDIGKYIYKGKPKKKLRIHL